MFFSFLVLLLCLPWIPVSSCANIGAAHFHLSRRGGPLSRHEPANLDYLKKLLEQTERRYAPFSRNIDGNKLVRTWKGRDIGTVLDTELLSGAGGNGSWYASLDVGPGGHLQSVEFDIDMLSPDFYTVQTTSGQGSQYNVFSSTHQNSDARVHPLCKSPSDTLHLTNFADKTSTTVLLPLCQPSKASLHTLLLSGSILGLSPVSAASSLSRLTSSGLLQQLVDRGMISKPIISLTLIDSSTGILSFGGTIAEQVEFAKLLSQAEVDALGDTKSNSSSREKRARDTLKRDFPTSLEDQFRWIPLRGAAEGWWTSMLAGLWVNGVKVLKNQPLLLDIQNPFIMAPPLAARRFYDSIGGCTRLPAPYEMFWKIPCLNRPKVMLEFGRWWFPVMSGEGSRGEATWGPAGGRLSLGSLESGKNGTGSGYCVGRLVETRMGLSRGKGEAWEGSGMKDVWVLGEPVFWGLGIVLDAENQRLGFRNY